MAKNDNDSISLNKTLVTISGNQLEEIRKLKVIVNGIEKKSKNKKNGTKGLNLGNALKSKISDIFSNAGKKMSGILSFAQKGISGAFGKVTGVFGKLKDTLIGSVSEKIKSIGKFANKLFGNDLETLQKKFYKLWTNPKKIANTLFNAMYDIERKMKSKENKKKTGKSTNSGVEEILASINKSIQIITVAVSFFFMGPGLGIALAIGLVPPVLILCGTLLLISILIIGFLKNLLEPLMPSITKLVDAVVNNLIPYTQMIIDAMVNSVLPVITILCNIITIILTIFESAFKTVAILLKSINFLLLKVVGIIEKILDFVDFIIGTISSLVQSILDPIKNAFITMQPYIESIASFLIETLGDIISKIASTMENIVSIANTITNFVRKIVEKFTSAPVETAVKAVKMVGGAVKSILPDSEKNKNESEINIIELFNSIIERFDIIDESILSILKFNKENITPIKERMNSFLDWFKMKIEFFVDQIKKFDFDKIDKILTKMTTNSNNKSGIIDKITGIVGNTLSSLFGGNSNENKSSPFDNLITTITDMKKSFEALMEQIRDACIKISENKIQIGNFDTNSGSIGDTKNIKDINVNVIQTSDLSKIEKTLESFTPIFNAIVKNTALKESGGYKDNALFEGLV